MIRPRNEPAIAATWLSPRASPRCSTGKASVMIAFALAMSIAPPMPCNTRITINHSTPAVPCIQVTVSSTENTVNTANPALYSRTRPKMSPSQPKVTTSTAVTTIYPMISHSSRLVLLGSSGLIPMPRKMSGNAINRIEELIVAINMPSVVFDSTIHL